MNFQGEQVVQLREVLQLAAAGVKSDDLLELSRDGTPCGDATIQIAARELVGGFSLESAGHVQSSAGQGLAGLTWQVAAGLREDLFCDEFSLRLRLAESDTSVMLDWKHGMKNPVIEVTRGREVVLDTEGALRQMEWASALGGKGLLGGVGGGGLGTIMAEDLGVVATRCRYHLAGEMRPGYAIRLDLLHLYKLEVLLSRAGEVIRVSLPNGWRLENSLLNDLDKGEARQ